MRFNCEYNGILNQLTFTEANDGAHIDIEYKRNNRAEVQVHQFHIDKLDAVSLGLALLEYAGREDALKFACRELALATSKDGSGHADLAFKSLELAGYSRDAAAKQVDEWTKARTWKPGESKLPEAFDFADAERRLAKLVIMAVECYNNGFDKNAAQQATTDALKTRAIVDYSQFQRITLHQACKEVCPSNWAEPVYYILHSAWNDALDWAEGINSMYTHGDQE